MKLEKESLKDSMHQIVYEVLRTSHEEVKEGYCTEIKVTLFADGRVRIVDNGRGIPLSQNAKANQERLDSILSGHPISNIEYAQMGDFAQCGMQVVNSLCENLQITVYTLDKINLKPELSVQQSICHDICTKCTAQRNAFRQIPLQSDMNIHLILIVQRIPT